jgi:hypothetical protein
LFFAFFIQKRLLTLVKTMKKLFILTLSLIFELGLNAQIVDDFNDNDLSSAPQWLGGNSNFINVNGALKSNSNSANTQFALSTVFNLSGELEWRLNVKLAFNPSSLNYIDFFMFADSSNLVKAKNGLFVRMGGSADEISFLKLVNGIETKLIDGKDGLLNVSSSQYTLSIIYKNDSITLFHQKQGQSNFVSEGSAYLQNLQFADYSGIRVRQSTSSFFLKHNFDDLYIGPLIKDSLAPQLDSLRTIGAKALICYFNEACDSFSLNKLNAYQLNGAIYPDSIDVIANNQVLIRFKDSFPINRSSVLVIKGIKDLFGNPMNQSSNFIVYQTEIPKQWDVLISELMVDPDPSAGLPNNEYVEIYNASSKFISLDNLTISDQSTNMVLPHKVLHPDSFYVLYTVPSLNNVSDVITLTNKMGTTIDEINYNDSWYHDDIKKQGGYSLERIDLQRPCMAANNWSASKATIGGTPNAKNSIAAKQPLDTIAPMLLNFYSSHDRFINFEFSEKIDTSNALQIQIKNNNLSLHLSSIQSPVYTYLWPYLPSKDSTFIIEIKGVKDCEQNLNDLIKVTFQWPSIADSKDIVVNEILFNPKPNGKDFIELFNNSNKTFDLSKLYFVDLDVNGMPNNYYPLSGSYKLFKPSTYALITEDTNSVCQNYACGKGQALYCQSNKLMGMPDKEGKVIVYNQLNIAVDSVSYNSNWHFKFLTDQNGVSLERLSSSMESNESNTWHSAASSVGYASPGSVNSQISVRVETDLFFNLNSRSLSPDMDGFEDLLILRYKFPEADYLSTIKIFNIEGKEMKTLINNKTLGTEGAIVWDGTDQNAEVLPIGVYLVLIECLSPSGELRREKLSILLAESL